MEYLDPYTLHVLLIKGWGIKVLACFKQPTVKTKSVSRGIP